MLGEAEYIKWKICVHNSSPGMLIPFVPLMTRSDKCHAENNAYKRAILSAKSPTPRADGIYKEHP